MPLPPLTRQQATVYAFLRQHIITKAYAPSLEEIGTGMGGLALATVHKHLEHLKEKGWITRRFGRARSIELLGVEPGICPHCGQRLNGQSMPQGKEQQG